MERRGESQYRESQYRESQYRESQYRDPGQALIYADGLSRQHYGTDVPTLRDEILHLRERAKRGYGSSSIYDGGFGGGDDTADTVSEVSSAEIGQAERETMRAKLLAEGGLLRVTSPFDDDGRDNIRQDQRSKKEARRAREKERRRSHGMPSAPSTQVYVQGIDGNFRAVNPNGTLGDHIPYDFIMGRHGVDDNDIHHGIGSQPMSGASHMTSGMRYSNHDGFSSAPPTVSVFENKGDGTTTTTTTTSVTRRTAKRLV
ncbi:hypothetical protein LTR10_008834 [Elasticomyces elasticus]|nr:hypothetical protein LTR10_008834 [Elasticomyces elasticus]KAK4974195.1 hypothetical protein LTR42_004834 [Elasticomyces elasticus]